MIKKLWFSRKNGVTSVKMKMQLKVAAEDNKIVFRGEGDLQLKAKATTLSLKKVRTTFERHRPLN